MYESEVNQAVVSAEEIPLESRAQFASFAREVARRSSLPWGEHCTECAWPTCYETCTLYSPRADLKCQRFADGVVRVDFDSGVAPFLLKVTFKRWAKLHAPASLRTVDAAAARSAETRDLRYAKFMRLLPGTEVQRIRRMRRRYVHKRDHITPSAPNAAGPTHFAIECYNPTDKTVDLSVVMGAVGSSSTLPFEHKATVAPAYNRVLIPVSDIGRYVDFGAPFNVDITPNLDGRLITLYFGCMDFVTLRQEAEAAPAPARPAKAEAMDQGKKVKCVIWDLDNTLWDGILIEDGIDGVKLKPGIREVIEELDSRGILHSVASKNNPADGLQALARFGLVENFLYPQISWEPKSIGIQRIAKSLDIGLDTFLFVDDSAFERAEVSETVPLVRVLDAAEFMRLPMLPECQVPVTAESRRRRQFYLDAVKRDSANEEFAGDYETFLKSCNLRIGIRPLQLENLKRVYELAQRTNQMNFSGNRYTIASLEAIMQSPDHRTFVIDCADRFGEYGIIGFCIVRNDEPRMTDLMFSCRIQYKRVDHAVLRFVISKYRGVGAKDFHADFRRTDKNAAAGKVFADFGFIQIGEREGVTDLLFAEDAALRDEGIVEVVHLGDYEGPA